MIWVLPRSLAGAVAVNKGCHQLAEGIIGGVQAVILDLRHGERGFAVKSFLTDEVSPDPRNEADLTCMGEKMGPSGCPHPLPLGWLL